MPLSATLVKVAGTPYPQRMFDPGILLSLEAAMPPQMPSFPAIVQERLLLSEFGEAAMREGMRRADEFDAGVDSWSGQLKAIRDKVQGYVVEGVASPQDLEKLDAHISRFERYAEDRAIGLGRLQKRVARDVKRNMQSDPSLGAAMRATSQRLIATEKRAIDALLEQALFLRAIRTEGLPESRGGPVFDDPDELSRYLDGIIAA